MGNPSMALGGSLTDWLSLSARTHDAWIRMLTGRRPRFEARTFAGSTGSRDYFLHIPVRRPRALLVMLHGCTQTAEGFALATRMNEQAEEHGLVVAYPEQTRAHHRKACWHWYRPSDQHRGAGEPAILAELTRELAAEFEVTADRVFVAGLSAGGAMAAILGENYPDLYAAVGVHSGLPCGVAVNLMSAVGAMKGHAGWTNLFQRAASGQSPRRTIVFHGTADSTVHPANAERVAAAATAGLDVRLSHTTGISQGGRPYAVTAATAANDSPLSELWLIEGSGHAWSGGSPEGFFTDPAGPNASAEMVRFFLLDCQPKCGLRNPGPFEPEDQKTPVQGQGAPAIEAGSSRRL